MSTRNFVETGEADKFEKLKMPIDLAQKTSILAISSYTDEETIES